MPVRCNPLLFSLAVSAAFASAGCGGGSPDITVAGSPPSASPAPGPVAGVPPPSADAPAAVPPPATASSCSVLPPMPARPANVKVVTDFGAIPNDSVDDTDAIQRALDSLSPGDWLVFPAGLYLHSKSLHMRVANTVMWSEGAALRGTNASDQAIWIEADGASIYNFTLTAVTTTRKTTPWESRISIFGGSNPGKLLHNNVIRGNRVVQGGDPGTALANSAGSAGIFVYRATNFLVAENTVARSMADGIHVTAGSSNGRVLNNSVKETGDDMIAVVSYVGDPSTPASTVAANLAGLRASSLNHHITIAGNMVSGQYWGRGISVVGGENVTIENNDIDRTTHAAAIYLARETSYLTFGVHNVLVRNNTITDVETTNPAYTAGTVSATAAKTGHGAIEIYSFVFTDEAAIASLSSALSVENIEVDSNTIARTRFDGFRIGTGWGKTNSFTVKRSDGSTLARSYTGGQVGLLGLTGNKMSSIGGQAIAINNRPTAQNNIMCSANTDDGAGASSSLCSGPKPPVVPACST